MVHASIQTGKIRGIIVFSPNCYDIVKANRNELTPEEEAPAEAAEEVSTDAAQEEFDVIGGSDNKPEQL